MVPGYAKGSQDMTLPECAGAAIFRANAGYAERQPEGMRRLPPDCETVFASPVELLARWFGSTEAMAELALSVMTPEMLFLCEMRMAADAGCQPIEAKRHG